MFLIGLIKIPQEKAEVVKKNIRKSKIIIIITVINNKIPIFPLAKTLANQRYMETYNILKKKRFNKGMSL